MRQIISIDDFKNSSSNLNFHWNYFYCILWCFLWLNLYSWACSGKINVLSSFPFVLKVYRHKLFCCIPCNITYSQSECRKVLHVRGYMKLKWNLDVTNFYLTKSSVYRTISFTPVIVLNILKRTSI